jgi:hypothetical protein
VTLDEEVSFFEWSREHWPSPSWTIELDPFTNTPEWH